MAKALGWQRLRTLHPKDPFFAEMATICREGLDQGLRILGLPGTPCPASASSNIVSVHPQDEKDDGGGGGGGGGDWLSVPCFQLALEVVSLVTSKSLFGDADFWDDPKFLEICREYAAAVPRDAMLLHTVPEFLKS